jgi:hypothetical protein
MHAVARELAATGGYADWREILKFFLAAGSFHAAHALNDPDFRIEIDAACAKAKRA